MPPGCHIERPEKATFKPIPPNLNIAELIQNTSNFETVTRIDARMINAESMKDVEAYIQDHVIGKGLPLVFENWHLREDWPSWIFNMQWLKENHGSDRSSTLLHHPPCNDFYCALFVENLSNKLNCK